MDRLPSSIIFKIFSRVSVKCLARSRCVSKVWCNYIDDRYLVIIHDKRLVEEPTPILYHPHLCREKITRSLCFHVIESKQTGASHNYVLEAKEDPFLEFLRKTPLSKSSRVKIRVQGSCNGLICLSQDDGEVVTSLVVVHPLRKECYELPPLSMRFDDSLIRDSCGFGFDASTNTLKMVCVLCKSNKVSNNPDVVKKYLCTMVHVFGTNSWREIPQVPPYPITDGAVFANGCLHWLVSYLDVPTEDGGRPVIWFDVEKEEFGLIDPPKRTCDLWRNFSCRYDQVVDLNGEFGYVCSRTMEFWVLNKQNKEWVPHCRFSKEITPYAYIYVMGCWNKDGDILLKCIGRGNGKYEFFVYNLKSGELQKTNIAGMEDGLSPSFIMYPNTLSSIHGINANSFSMKKTGLKKSCQHVLSNFR
ncbi:F-box domain-containing protein [Artemisia annua]|uniref:F-box domain-containing protein n=1 Tax=Artemisia annua TaxID=35608 RepID=A0A2U1LRS3_ARTAN|nr:F-box domain-containing protein [Artemisia annua]